MKKMKMNIQQGWRHHADLPLPGVQKSHPALSKIWHPQQGSWRTATCREYVQHLLHTKYNCLIR